MTLRHTWVKPTEEINKSKVEDFTLFNKYMTNYIVLKIVIDCYVFQTFQRLMQIKRFFGQNKLTFSLLQVKLVRMKSSVQLTKKGWRRTSGEQEKSLAQTVLVTVIEDPNKKETLARWLKILLCFQKQDLYVIMCSIYISIPGC